MMEVIIRLSEVLRSLVVQDDAPPEPNASEEPQTITDDCPEVRNESEIVVQDTVQDQEEEEIPIVNEEVIEQQILALIQDDNLMRDESGPSSPFFLEPHPWGRFYDQESARGPENSSKALYAKCTLEHVQAFRCVSRDLWAVLPRTTNLSMVVKTGTTESNLIPDQPFAFYSVIAKNAKMLILTPVFNEIAADDRLDLRVVQLNYNSRDTMNPGMLVTANHFIGEVLCVTKLQRTLNAEQFWEVSEYHQVPRNILHNIITSPYCRDGDTSWCVAGNIKGVIGMALTPPIGHLLSTVVFVPTIKPGQFLYSLRKDGWRHVTARCPRFATTNSYVPHVIQANTLHPQTQLAFKHYREAFKIWKRKDAYNVLKHVVDFGSNGLTALKNVDVDSEVYPTRIHHHFYKYPSIHFEFTINSVNHAIDLMKWDRTVTLRIATMSYSFHAEVVSAQMRGSSVMIEAKTSHYDEDSFKRVVSEELFVNQIEERAGKDINFDIEEGSNADRFIQALYGGPSLPEIDIPDSDVITVGNLQLLATQTKYVRMVAHEDTVALVGSSSFGCGKTAAIAAAALYAHEKNPTKFQMITAITNCACKAIIEKLVQLNPKVKIVRIISALNTAQLPYSQLSLYDYPTLISSVLREMIVKEDVRRQQGLEPTQSDSLIKQAMFYLKKKSYFNEECLKCDEMRRLFNRAEQYNEEDLLKCYMTIETPSIIVGTVQSVLNGFTNSWQSYIDKVSMIQIDEASTLPRETLLRIVTLFPNSKFSMVGDYRQLTPYVEHGAIPILIETAIGETLRDCVTGNLLPSVFLNGVFRCRPEVTELLGDLFYESSLVSLHIKSITEEKLKTSPAWTLHRSNDYPIIFIDTRHSNSRSVGYSLCNVEESKAAMNLADHLLKYVEPEHIAILCFYRGQVVELRDFGDVTGVYVGSVDSAQGREWPISIICTTKTSSCSDNDFLANENRINVALSRSKHLNFIFGTMQSLYTGMWRKVIDKCAEQQTFEIMSDFNRIIASKVEKKKKKKKSKNKNNNEENSLPPLVPASVFEVEELPGNM